MIGGMNSMYRLIVRDMSNWPVATTEHPTMGAGFVEVDRAARERDAIADTLVGEGDRFAAGQFRLRDWVRPYSDTVVLIGTWRLVKI
jgi:hypothetical protein